MSTSMYLHASSSPDGKCLHELTFMDLGFPEFYGFMAWLGCAYRNRHHIPQHPDVRNLSREESKDLDEVHGWGNIWYHVSLDALLAFDYDQTFEDRRPAFSGDAVEPGQGEVVSYREFFGNRYFEALQQCNDSGYNHFWYYFD